MSNDIARIIQSGDEAPFVYELFDESGRTCIRKMCVKAYTAGR